MATNVPGVRRTIGVLKGRYKADGGRAAYVVLSGPSLFRNFKESPPHDDDVVIGVNRGAVEFCGAFQRPVDYLLVADGIVSPAYVNRQWGHIHARRVVANICASPDVTHFSDREPFWFRAAGWGHEQIAMGVPMDLPELEYSFNTGTMALHLADILGCNPIVFVGCDQALTGGEFHPGEKAAESSHNVIACPDIHGNWTLARIDQFIAARKMEAWAFILKQYGVRVVNLTGAGIVKRFVETSRS